MKVEISTNRWIKLPAHEAVHKAAALGFKHIQIGTPHFSGDLDKIVELRKKHKLTYSVHAPFFAEKDFIATASYKDPVDLEHSRQIFFKSIENAKYVGAKKIVIHASEPHYHEGVPQLVESMDLFAKKAAELDIIVCMENKFQPSEVGYAEHELWGVLKEVSHPNIKMCFDTAHAAAATGSLTEMLHFLKDMTPFIADVHLVPVDTFKRTDVHEAPKPNEYYYENVVKILKDAKYKGDLTFEAAYDTDENVLKGMKYIEGLIKKYKC
ncbi:MAG: sugar phosphate isomerase/epimerase family protein [Candidatus Undinarchaeales archaeon]|jgi:sugar phosphate isomerase/epimerase|nr:sugar phosphate isomerase/epimerase family protein [Candidatus Undinarchaeales archaeon]